MSKGFVSKTNKNKFVRIVLGGSIAGRRLRRHLRNIFRSDNMSM